MLAVRSRRVLQHLVGRMIVCPVLAWTVSASRSGSRSSGKTRVAGKKRVVSAIYAE